MRMKSMINSTEIESWNQKGANPFTLFLTCARGL
jgi:hypothetical protein